MILYKTEPVEIFLCAISVCNITAGHWPFSDHFASLARQFQHWLAILSGQIQEILYFMILLWISEIVRIAKQSWIWLEETICQTTRLILHTAFHEVTPLSNLPH